MLLGGKANLLGVLGFGGWIIHVWGAICGIWGLAPVAPLSSPCKALISYNVPFRILHML